MKVLIAIALLLGGCGDPADPAATIEDYVTAYNAGDIDGVMALFSHDSVVTGHPFATEARGLEAIRSLQLADLAAAATENAYTISNVQVSGSTVTWGHLWVSADGQEFCQQG